MACGTTQVARGLTTWFCCGNAFGPCGAAGHGACGTCNSGSHQCAWPNISSACLGVTNPGRCGLNLGRFGCGHRFFIENLCNSRCVGVTIADCGPATDQFCGERVCCGSTCGTNRVMDLTPSAFSSIGSLSAGILPCRVAN